MSLQTDLVNAGLPVVLPVTEGVTVLFTRPLTAPEEDVYESIVNPVLYRQRQATIAANAIPGWASWTQVEFETWCTNNLMTDAQIDAATLSAALKANIKANNAFVRNAGKMIIALRNHTRIIE